MRLTSSLLLVSQVLQQKTKLNWSRGLIWNWNVEREKSHCSSTSLFLFDCRCHSKPWLTMANHYNSTVPIARNRLISQLLLCLSYVKVLLCSKTLHWSLHSTHAIDFVPPTHNCITFSRANKKILMRSSFEKLTTVMGLTRTNGCLSTGIKVWFYCSYLWLV